MKIKQKGCQNPWCHWAFYHIANPHRFEGELEGTSKVEGANGQANWFFHECYVSNASRNFMKPTNKPIHAPIKLIPTQWKIKTQSQTTTSLGNLLRCVIMLNLILLGLEAIAFKLKRCRIKDGSCKDPKWLHFKYFIWYMGVSKNRGTSKRMVYNGKPY